MKANIPTLCKVLKFITVVTVVQFSLCAALTTSGGTGPTTTVATITTARNSMNNLPDQSPPGTKPVRPIPEKVIIGYATECDDKVKVAIEQGVNVVIWAFLNIVQRDKKDKDYDQDNAINLNEDYFIEGSLDLDCIEQFIKDMDNAGYNDTLHLVSFGGWNGPHMTPDTCVFESAQSCYEAWKRLVGHIFHGIDWDPEGNTDLTSRWNLFSVESLDMMGLFSRYAKRDGYAVTMAPAQSYLDIKSTKFSRYVNLTDPTRQASSSEEDGNQKDQDDRWHGDFHYFGANVYAYLLAKYSDCFDLISIQFYESYSRAGLEIHHHGMTPEDYLRYYIQDLMNKGQHYFVEFESDPTVQLKNQYVLVPLNKVVWGFANGWALANNERHIYFLPECIQAAYQGLVDWQMEPRGFMFWVIGEEGQNNIHYAKELNGILHVRTKNKDDDDNGNGRGQESTATTT